MKRNSSLLSSHYIVCPWCLFLTGGLIFSNVCQKKKLNPDNVDLIDVLSMQALNVVPNITIIFPNATDFAENQQWARNLRFLIQALLHYAYISTYSLHDLNHWGVLGSTWACFPTSLFASALCSEEKHLMNTPKSCFSRLWK